MIYCGSWRYLPKTHSYQQVWTTFNGEIENMVALVQMSA
jgi:hypothetical protein